STPFNPGNGLINQGTLQLNSAQFNTTFFDNVGTASGSASMTLGDFINSGLLNASSLYFGVQVSSSAVNTGTINVGSIYFSIYGADFINKGTFNLAGGTFFSDHNLSNDL